MIFLFKTQETQLENFFGRSRNSTRITRAELRSTTEKSENMMLHALNSAEITKEVTKIFLTESFAVGTEQSIFFF